MSKWQHVYDRPAFVYSLLFLAAAIGLIQLWGLPILGGDDPGLAVDRFARGDSIWASTVIQARAQGRFYYLIPWGLTQIPYLWESWAPLSLARIVPNIAVYVTFFGLLRSIWNTSFALLASSVGLGIFNYYGGEFNSFHSTPLWYALAAAILFLSLWLFNEACKKHATFVPAFVLFFLCLLFYEAMLLYTPAFLFIYLAHNPAPENSWRRHLVRAAIDLRGLVVVLSIYFACYIAFRMYYPSAYEGSKALHFVSIGRMLKTILVFSMTGVYLLPPLPKFREFWVYGAGFASLTTLATLLILRGRAKELRQSWEPRSYWIVAAAIAYMVLAPNLLYGFVDKYHVWVDQDPYYNGSYLGSFALITLFAFIGQRIWAYAQTYRRPHLLQGFLLIGLFLATTGNFAKALRMFDEHRDGSYRWPLLRNVVSQVQEQLVAKPVVCTMTLNPKKDGFFIYNYWTAYLSHYLGAKIQVQQQEAISPDCHWVLDYKVSDNEAIAELRDIESGRTYRSVQER